MDISAIALQGVQQAETQLNQAAGSIASASSTGDAVDLSAAMIALMSAQNQTSVNLDVLKTSDEIQKATLDIMA